ncbi:hypothetical protein [Pseudarthrobacter phenanthrenivorans]|uniref:Uncharacterized protein n=1 Tax=Pseudarthrobacter phenanthrenivorans TaxID=361575 RepID=A0A0B4DW95_PSEPS|nr:hypothetical protein [Pseudarthrobacter phenanthrenivorans]KIC68720.1 hypothetical protein RM50_04495 [Pseudarthrobacter phenanthrenivorans]
MTISPEAPAPNVPVDVRFTTAGTPLAVRYDGKLWPVAAEPLHWFTRDSWWVTRKSVPVGIGNVVDIEHWRLQVRADSMSPLRTFELRREPLSEQWLLESISDD